jgi:type III pantothenate kinase
VLLAADVGNTEIVLGVFDGPAPGSLIHTWRLSTRPERTADEVALHLTGFLGGRGIDLARDLHGFVVGSVVPDVTAALREFAERYLPFELLVVGPGTKTGVSVLTDNPREVGADRVVNTLAAFARFGGPAVVVDFGTSTNFDVVSEHGEFLGGVIAPGLQISAASLFARPARRSAGTPSRPSSRVCSTGPPGRSTRSSTGSGPSWVPPMPRWSRPVAWRPS